MRGKPSGCLVRDDQLAPGDIILSTGWQKESEQLVKWAAGIGPFSHAGLVKSRFSVFESDDYGAGAAPVPSKVLRVHGEVERWIYLPYPIGRFVVVRHPRLSQRDLRQLESEVRAACDRYNWLPYSKLPRLINASRVADAFRPIARWLVRMKDDRNPDSPVEGVFCSEVVALIYKELGVNLFPTGTAADTISPNLLANTHELQPILLVHVISQTEARRLNLEVDFHALSDEWETNRKIWVKPFAEMKEDSAQLDIMLRKMAEESEASRREATEKYALAVREARQEMLAQLHKAARYRFADWYHQILTFYQALGTQEQILQAHAGDDSDAARAIYTTAFVESYRLMVDFSIARLDRDLEDVHYLLNHTSLLHPLKWWKYRRWQHDLTGKRAKAQTAKADLPRMERTLRDADAVIHESRAQPSRDPISPAPNGETPA